MIKTFKNCFKCIYPAFCLAVGLSAALTSCTAEEKKELKAPIRKVRTMVLDGATHVSHTRFSGRLHSAKEASLSFKVAGTIRSIAVNVGDPVEKGRVIATLDPSSYALEAQQSKAALAEAESELRNAKSEYDRVKQLYIGGNESKSALDNARAAADSSHAAVQASRKALEIALLNLSYTRLIAEENCAIASVDAEVGENVAQGEEVFYTTCGSELEVKLDIPEKVISDIQKGMGVKVTFPAFDGRTYGGIVNEVGVSPVGGSTTFPVTVRVAEHRLRDPMVRNDRNGDLKPGLSADVHFAIAIDRSNIVVPPFAVGEDQDGRFAFVLDTTLEGRALVKRQPVVVGDVRQAGVEVVRGLEPGMRIVTAGVSVIRAGMEVAYNE